MVDLKMLDADESPFVPFARRTYDLNKIGSFDAIAPSLSGIVPSLPSAFRA